MKTLLLITMLATIIYPGKRQVLIFYNDGGSAMKDKQLVLLNTNKQELTERDIEIHIYKISDAKPEVKRRNISSTATFTFILLGKDGHVAVRTDTIVSTQQLIATIDAMPMRKQEMKHKE